MQQGRTFQVVQTARMMAVGLWICDEPSTQERRQWHYWKGNPLGAVTGKEEMNSAPQKQNPWEIRKLQSLNISAIYSLSREPKGKNYICILFKPEFFSWKSLLIVPVYRTIFSTCSWLAATEDQLCPSTCPSPAHTISLLPSPHSWLEVTLRKSTEPSRPPENNWLSLWKYLTDAPLP